MYFLTCIPLHCQRQLRQVLLILIAMETTKKLRIRKDFNTINSALLKTRGTLELVLYLVQILDVAMEREMPED